MPGRPSDRPFAVAALPDAGHSGCCADLARDVSLVLACPMCHTPMPLAQGAIRAGAGWPCVRCGQRWDSARLSAVAAYAAWVVARFASGIAGGEPLIASPDRPRPPTG